MTKIQQYNKILNTKFNYSEDLLIYLLEQLLSNKRYNHVMGVLSKSKELAELLKLEEIQIYDLIQAVLFHDFAKGMSSDELYSYALEKNIDLHGVVPAMYHAIISTWMAQEYFAIKNVKVLDAIFYHTTGNSEFIKNKIGMILFLADYLEPGRMFNKNHIEQYIPFNINKALYIIVKEKLISVLQKDKILATESINFYYSLLELME